MSVALQEPGLVEAPRPVRRRAVWQVVRRRPSAAIGLVVLLAIIVVALLAPLIAPYGLHDEVGPVFGHPSWSHPLGLDDGGVDMVTLLMWGARISLVVGFAATLVSMLVGGAIGVLAGYFGRWVDVVLMRITDYFIAIPDVPLMIAVAIFDETALAFLGLGDPSRISLGKVIQNAFQRTAVSSGAWWAIVPPGALVALLILSCSLIGQALEDALNPRLRVAHLSARRFRLRPLVGRGSEAV